LRLLPVAAAIAAAVLALGAGAAAASPGPSLVFGAQGAAVTTLQNDLVDLGYSHAAATPGSFGAETWLALTAFERTAFPGTVATGDVDALVWASIGHALATEGGAPIGTTALSSGAQGPAVATLQGDLMQLGYTGIPSATGHFDAATQSAVSAFQRKSGLPVTGVMDGATLRALERAMPATAGTIDGHAYTSRIDLVATAYGPSLQDNYPYGPFDVFGKPLVAGDVAVDPSVIPLNAHLYVAGYSSPYLPRGGELAVARDTGGAIQGKRIDMFVNGTATQVSSFGIQHVVAYILSS